MTSPLLIIGAGGHGRSIAEAALAGDTWRPIGFVDDSVTHSSLGLPVLGPMSRLAEYRAVAECAIVAIGNNRVRETLHLQLRALEFRPATTVHRSAVVSPTARFCEGCAIMAGAIVGTEAVLGEGVIINCGAVVDHHCHVDDYGHLGTNACMAGGSRLGHGAWMQAGSALGYAVHLPAGSILAAGEGLVVR